MSLAGFKKQLNKANQMLNEKVGGAKGTELEDEFVEMERKVDVSVKLIEDVVVKTQEFLQPNPASRAKMSTMVTLGKLQGKQVSATYPQPEGLLGDTMTKYGKELGDDSAFGKSLVEAGDSFRQLADIKYNLEDHVRQNFIEPLNNLQTTDLKEINFHRKKVHSRRLDFDCKKRKQEKASQVGSKQVEDEVHMAEEKFEESKQVAEAAMVNFLESDIEQIGALSEFISSQKDYHSRARDILEELEKTLEHRMNDFKSRPKQQGSTGLAPKTKSEDRRSSNSHSGGGGSMSEVSNPSPGPVITRKAKHDNGGSAQTPTCRAIYEFVADTATELSFKEGDIIKLIQQVDENWFLGEIKGKTGHFPVNYVEVLIPIKE